MRKETICLGLKVFGVVLAVAGATVAAGLLAFIGFGFQGSFFSAAGLECTGGALLGGVALCASFAIALDNLHSHKGADPHSPIGRSLRGHAPHSTDPPIRQAWDGNFEDPSQAASKMKKGR